MTTTTTTTCNDDYSDEERGIDADGADAAEAELRAEFTMSWVHGGGAPEDASAAYSLFGGAR